MQFNKILLTGSESNIGKRLRPHLSDMFPKIRLSDRLPTVFPHSNEEIQQCELADADAVQTLVQGCDGIIHLGGIASEDTFANILNSNIIGLYNVYEAARKNGVKRILFASSNHVIGFHDVTTRLDAHAEMRPDSLYGVSKGYGELVARYYYDKYGVETVSVRIGSCFPKPTDKRMLRTWLSDSDLLSLIQCVFTAPVVGYCVVYGVSDNQATWWDNGQANFLGWHPKDSSAKFVTLDHIQNEVVDPNHKKHHYQGGTFAANGHFED